MPARKATMTLAVWRKEFSVYDEELAWKTKQIDPEGKGVSERTIRAIRCQHRATLRQAALIHAVSEGRVPVLSMLDPEWLQTLAANAGMEEIA